MHFCCIHIETSQHGFDIFKAGSQGLTKYAVVVWCRATWAPSKINYKLPAHSLIQTNVSYRQQPWWLLLGCSASFLGLSSLSSKTSYHKVSQSHDAMSLGEMIIWISTLTVTLKSPRLICLWYFRMIGWLYIYLGALDILYGKPLRARSGFLCEIIVTIMFCGSDCSIMYETRFSGPCYNRT